MTLLNLDLYYSNYLCQRNLNEVGRFYYDFSKVTDEEVINFLNELNTERKRFNY